MFRQVDGFLFSMQGKINKANRKIVAGERLNVCLFVSLANFSFPLLL